MAFIRYLISLLSHRLFGPNRPPTVPTHPYNVNQLVSEDGTVSRATYNLSEGSDYPSFSAFYHAATSAGATESVTIFDFSCSKIFGEGLGSPAEIGFVHDVIVIEYGTSPVAADRHHNLFRHSRSNHVPNFRRTEVLGNLAGPDLLARASI